MSDASTDARPPLKRRRPTHYLLRAAAVAILALCLAAGTAELVGSWTDGGSARATAIASALVCIALGLGAAAALFGLSAALRGLRSVHSAIVRIEKYQYELGESARTSREESDHAIGDATLPIHDPTVPSEAPTQTGVPWQEMLSLLQEMRDNSLLTEAQRQEKRLRNAESDFRQAADSVQAVLREREFARARQIAENLLLRYPDDPRAEALLKEIEASREKSESQDVSAITRQVEDLITISAWQRARQVVQHLMERHPDSPEARQLWLRIEREHRSFLEEQRRRMHAEVQRFVSRKRWVEALVAAKTFIERFPGCPEAEALLVQIPTLEGNAEIEHRQQLEARIMDYAKHGRYIEAAQLAREVIERYPDSPQAEILRSQLPRLDELATDPSAPPARVRID